jgi:hypothetical protein
MRLIAAMWLQCRKPLTMDNLSMSWEAAIGLLRCSKPHQLVRQHCQKCREIREDGVLEEMRRQQLVSNKQAWSQQKSTAGYR